ncbi:hypothetical protein ACFVGN_05715 [Streptomyces sp. NPDC057757]|uniref:hypothetical protein n=1 Tax=Streptomyces sp. NPDC057757 TaxID=3346241 RepID=UPI003699EEE8
MTVLWWALWVAAVVAIAWRAMRALDEPLDRDRIAADAHATTEHLIGTGPDPDAEPGFDVVLQDQCELMWSIPNKQQGDES